MPARSVSDDELIDRLTGLFRDSGFEGTTLTRIAAATGLQKSSLYHRFPGGKEQMAAEVATTVGQHFAGDVLAPLGADKPLPARVRMVMANVEAFYEGGTRSCLLESLSVGPTVPAATRHALAAAARAWVDAFAAVAREAGARGAEAKRRAEQAVALIEGALVLARLQHDPAVFRRALDAASSLILRLDLEHP